MNDKEQFMNEILKKVLIEIIFIERKNFNTKQYTDSEMIKNVKRIVEREVKKYAFQENKDN